jgi:hypothetical protein
MAHAAAIARPCVTTVRLGLGYGPSIPAADPITVTELGTLLHALTLAHGDAR